MKTGTSSRKAPASTRALIPRFASNMAAAAPMKHEGKMTIDLRGLPRGSKVAAEGKGPLFQEVKINRGRAYSMDA